MLINLFPEVKDDVKCLVLFKTNRYVVYCHRGLRKIENIHILLSHFRR